MSSSEPQTPAFWFGFEVTWAKLVLARSVLFALLALDALLQIRHAPRYGAGGFNVAQLPGIGWLAPTRGSYGTVQLFQAYAFVMVACGVATRVFLPIATALYAWLYFGSQLDSYQHHYLIAIVLALACFVPWQRPPGAHAATPVRSWALRLILVQLGILYFWAAVSKMTPAWLDGRTLDQQIGGTVRSLVDHTLGVAWTSKLVLVVELALAGTVWLRPAWWVAAVLGLGLHLGIVFTGLEIGLFAWLMIAMYILVVPDVVWVALARAWPWALPAAAARPRARGATGVAVLAGGLLAILCRLPAALPVGLGLAAAPIALAITQPPARSRRWLAAAHVLALLLWVGVDRVTTVTTDYARLWGGAAKRLGDLETAERAYRRLVELAPDDGGAHWKLGRVLLDRDQADAGLAELHAAQQLEPGAARAYVEEARWLQRHGQLAEATEKAREGTYAEPSNAEARAVLDALSGARKAPAAHPDEDREAP